MRLIEKGREVRQGEREEMEEMEERKRGEGGKKVEGGETQGLTDRSVCSIKDLFSGEHSETVQQVHYTLASSVLLREEGERGGEGRESSREIGEE